MTVEQKPVILDCSISVAWFFEDEACSKTDSFLKNIHSYTVIIPNLWQLEIS